MEEEASEGLPLIGRVAAGEPLLAQEHIEAHYQVDANLFKPSADFLLRVGYVDERYRHYGRRDLLAVHKHRKCAMAVVVARIDDEVTVKRWKKQRVVQLLPENDFQPIVVDTREQSLTVEGWP